MDGEALAEVWDVSAYVLQYFSPCIAVGAILPGFGVMIGAVIRAALIVTGLRDADI